VTINKASQPPKSNDLVGEGNLAIYETITTKFWKQSDPSEALITTKNNKN
jgi:hypothetical protein